MAAINGAPTRTIDERNAEIGRRGQHKQDQGAQQVWASRSGMMRFRLVRCEDETGVSGAGHVADGVQFSDGACAMRWRTDTTSTAVYDSIEDVVRIHGHNGKTQVEWWDTQSDIDAQKEIQRRARFHDEFYLHHWDLAIQQQADAGGFECGVIGGGGILYVLPLVDAKEGKGNQHR